MFFKTKVVYTEIEEKIDESPRCINPRTLFFWPIIRNFAILFKNSEFHGEKNKHKPSHIYRRI